MNKRAILTKDGFMVLGKVIQASYIFTNIQKTDEDSERTVYSALMKVPFSMPCSVVITDDNITISALDGNNVHIKY